MGYYVKVSKEDPSGNILSRVRSYGPYPTWYEAEVKRDEIMNAPEGRKLIAEITREEEE